MSILGVKHEIPCFLQDQHLREINEGDGHGRYKTIISWNQRDKDRGVNYVRNDYYWCNPNCPIIKGIHILPLVKMKPIRPRVEYTP